MNENAPVGKNTHVKTLLTLVFVLLVMLVYIVLPVEELLRTFAEYIKGLGWVGVVLLIVLYSLATIFLLPGAPLSIVAGLVYGFWGFPIVVVAAMISTVISFISARTLFYKSVHERVKNNKTFHTIDRAIEESGWKVVFLLRLSPLMPFSLQNWMLGVTSISFWNAVPATLFGIMPGVLMYVWIGTLGESALSQQSISGPQYVLFAVGIAATIAAMIYIGRIAQQKLREYAE